MRACQTYLEDIAWEGEWEDFITKRNEIFFLLNHAIMEIVTGFAQKRAGSFRKERD